MAEIRILNIGNIFFLNRNCEPGLYPFVNEEVKYAFISLLAYYAVRYDITIYAFSLRPDGYSLICGTPDENSDLPMFQNQLNSKLATATNQVLGRTGSVFDHKTSYTTESIESLEQLLIAYSKIYCEHFKHGFSSQKHWENRNISPALTSNRLISITNSNKGAVTGIPISPLEFVTTNTTLRIQRSQLISESIQPDEFVNLTLSLPLLTQFNGLDPQRLIEQYCEKAYQAIAQTRSNQESRAPIEHEAFDFLPAPSLPLYPPYPFIDINRLPEAVEFDYKTIMSEEQLIALTATEQRQRDTRRNFKIAYRRALTSWRSGNREVCFPIGTYKMVKLHKVNTQSQNAIQQE